MGQTALLPLRRKVCWGFEPAKLGTKGQHATSRPPKQLIFTLTHLDCEWQLKDLEVAIAYSNGFLEGRRKTASDSKIPRGRKASKRIIDSAHARTQTHNMILLNNKNLPSLPPGYFLLPLDINDTEQVKTAALLIASFIHGRMDFLAANSCIKSTHFMSLYKATSSPYFRTDLTLWHRFDRLGSDTCHVALKVTVSSFGTTYRWKVKVKGKVQPIIGHECPERG